MVSFSGRWTHNFFFLHTISAIKCSLDIDQFLSVFFVPGSGTLLLLLLLVLFESWMPGADSCNGECGETQRVRWHRETPQALEDYTILRVI